MPRDIGDVSTIGEVTADYLVRIVDNPNSDYPVEKLIPGAELTPAAAGVSVTDTAGYYTGTNVEAVLAELHLVFDVKSYGAVGDGITNDTAAIQAAIDACPAGGVVYFPQQPGSGYLTTTALDIDAAITIQGAGQYTCRVIASGCNGFTVNKNSSVSFRDIEIAQAVRHTTTPNALIGINVLGDTTDRPFHHVYSNVFVDGFQTAITTNWLWSSSFTNFDSAYGRVGLQVNGLSVNNRVTGGIIDCAGLASSKGIALGDGVTSMQGWVISGVVINDAAVAIDGLAATFITVADCIFDHCGATAVRIGDNGSEFGGCWNIHNNYMAIEGATNTSAVLGTNTIANYQSTGNIVSGNIILAYPGSTVNSAIALTGSQCKNDIVSGNSIGGGAPYVDYATAAIVGLSGNNQSVRDNTIQSPNKGITGADFVRENTGYNPVGVVAPAVPATGVATAAVAYDRTFYLSPTTNNMTATIQGGPGVDCLINSVTSIFVPAGKTLTPTYAGGLTWVVMGH